MLDWGPGGRAFILSATQHYTNPQKRPKTCTGWACLVGIHVVWNVNLHVLNMDHVSRQINQNMHVFVLWYMLFIPQLLEWLRYFVDGLIGKSSPHQWAEYLVYSTHARPHFQLFSIFDIVLALWLKATVILFFLFFFAFKILVTIQSILSQNTFGRSFPSNSG